MDEGADADPGPGSGSGPGPGPAGDDGVDPDRTPGFDNRSNLDDAFDRGTEQAETLIRFVELIAAFILVLLFAVGVFDLSLQIFQRTVSGDITDPLVVVGFIDTALLLLIIVEVFQTVLAYMNESDTRQIVRLVIYTGVIAMVRKVIIFRTEVFDDKSAALLTAGSYTLIIVGLAALLVVERRTSA